jgi:hypothetical protein
VYRGVHFLFLKEGIENLFNRNDLIYLLSKVLVQPEQREMNSGTIHQGRDGSPRPRSPIHTLNRMGAQQAIITRTQPFFVFSDALYPLSKV